MMDGDRYSTGKLTASPENFKENAQAKVGVLPLESDKLKDDFVYVPQQYSSHKPAALAVMFHGAGAPAEQGLDLLRNYADEYNIILLAPASRKYSWDIIASDSFGPDVLFIEQALAFVFENYAIDPEHVAIGGFSDGASYALSIGLTNGDLFTHIISFSPGFSYTLQNTGKPSIFVSHGINDPVLPIDPCSRRIIPLLKRQGYNVTYLEFDGKHEIPASISEKAVKWFISRE